MRGKTSSSAADFLPYEHLSRISRAFNAFGFTDSSNGTPPALDCRVSTRLFNQECKMKNATLIPKTSGIVSESGTYTPECCNVERYFEEGATFHAAQTAKGWRSGI